MCPDDVTVDEVATALSLVVVTGPGWDDFDWDGVEAEVESWSQAQRGAALEWAWASHFRAGDNEDIVVPPRPEWFPEDWR